MSGITKDTDVKNMIITPNEIINVIINIYTAEANSIPIGVYPITFDGTKEPKIESNSIEYATVQIAPEGVSPTDANKIKEYELIKGTLTVTKKGDIYTLKLESTLETGKKIEVFYHGKIN